MEIIPLSLSNARSKELPKVKKSLRAKIPYLTTQQIRRLKLPLADALQIELKEENLIKSSSLFCEMLKIDKNHNNCFSNGENSKLLLEIFDSLKEIDKTDEVTAILNMTKKLFAQNDNFDWLIEFFLIKCDQLIADYNLEQSKTHTILAYLHGLSLSHRLNWHRAALLQFELAFKNILKNDDWTFEDDENFGMKISQELANCLISLSQQIRIDERRPKDAAIYAGRALTVLRKVMATENFKCEIEAEIEFGNCLLDQCSFDDAKCHFEHGLALSENFGIKGTYCECLVKIAQCHKG